VNPIEATQVLAEVSATFTGFAAIAVVLRRVQSNEQFLRDMVAVIFGFSLGALLFALLPTILHLHGVDPPNLWRPLSAVQAVYLLAAGVLIRLMHIRRRETWGNDAATANVANMFHFGGAGVLAWNAVSAESPGWYSSGVVLMLGLAAWTLIYVIYPPTRIRG
jgi:hypothetical protein